MTTPRRSRIVIVGGGFAGLAAAKALRRAEVDITLVDRRNHHVFQPLLYQVATAALSPADIAVPIRKTLRKQKNVTVLLGEVSGVDADARRLKFDGHTLEYDYLIVAAGVTHSYFGHDAWSRFAPGLKSVEDALEIRRRFLLAFERAELETDPEARKAALTFVVVGGGPTGVEMAGAMAEICRTSITRDFRRIDTSTARVLLIEAEDRVLVSFPPECSAKALDHLRSLGVDVRLNSLASGIDGHGVSIGSERIDASNVIWAAGVQASALGSALGAKTDNAGKVEVGADLSVVGRPEIFVVGDMAHVVDPNSGSLVPGVAPAAVQMGNFVGALIAKEVAGTPQENRANFRYFDKGMLATIGRNRAVAAIGKARFSGTVAWLLWALVHIFFLINFRNRIVVLIAWTWMYVFYDRGARLITEPPEDPCLSDLSRPVGR